MKTGANVRVIPLGKDVTAVIHVVSVALRAALIFGKHSAAMFLTGRADLR